MTIAFQKVTKQYNDQTVVKNVSLTIQTGELFVLVGPSGSGKTTTLKMINRLIDPSAGTIMIDQETIQAIPLRTLRLNTGYVLQQIALFPNMTVRENIELIPEMKGWSKEQRLKRTKELLVKVGLDPDKYLMRYPQELSGGEQQRIGILRAIIAEPSILLMDEPFSALDPISRQQLQDLTIFLHKELGITIVFVTHDMNEALRIADRICIMRQGSVVQIDTPENIRKQPANEFVEKLFQTITEGGDAHE